MFNKKWMLFISMILLIVINLHAEEKIWGGERADIRFRIVCLQQGEDHRAHGNPGVIKNITALMELAREGAKKKSKCNCFSRICNYWLALPRPGINSWYW